MKSTVAALALTLLLPTLALASDELARPPKADVEALKQTALNYIEGWYEGDAARMESALHPDLAKRLIRILPDGKSRIEHMGAMALFQGTRAGYGTQTPPEKRQKDVTILDVYENSAVVKVVASDWIDYLQVARVNGRWLIVNVLWELKPVPAR